MITDVRVSPSALPIVSNWLSSLAVKPHAFTVVDNAWPQTKLQEVGRMKYLKTRRRTLIVVLALVLTMAVSALAWGGIATSPLGFKPLAGLGSCPLGVVTRSLTP